MEFITFTPHHVILFGPLEQLGAIVINLMHKSKRVFLDCLQVDLLHVYHHDIRDGISTTLLGVLPLLLAQEDLWSKLSFEAHLDSTT